MKNILIASFLLFNNVFGMNQDNPNMVQLLNNLAKIHAPIILNDMRQIFNEYHKSCAKKFETVVEREISKLMIDTNESISCGRLNIFDTSSQDGEVIDIVFAVNNNLIAVNAGLFLLDQGGFSVKNR